MEITHLKAIKFRNYDNLTVDFKPSGGIFVGQNAQGKTNLLEMIHTAAMGKSHRTTKYREMVKWESDGFYIKIEGKKKAGFFSNELGYIPPRKKVKTNGIERKKMSELLGNVNIVMFSPQDLEIVKGNPHKRRIYIDKILCQIDPIYNFHLNQYYKILKNRNIILKMLKYKKGNRKDELDIYNHQLVQTGSKVINIRWGIMEKLQQYCIDNHKRLTQGKEELKLKYRPSFQWEDDNDLETITKNFSKLIDKVIDKEIERGITLYGPHKDDFFLNINNKEVSLYGSQGQQRTTILSLKLSEVDILSAVAGEKPVLLLDDVMSELDNLRRNYLIESIKNIQTFITCTSLEGLGDLSNKLDIFTIKNGNISNRRGF